jgi:environmental stress-induced protein Ves
MMHVVHLDRVAPQPWRNGGGVTHELLAWPATPVWRLRISVAEIQRDGPFSAYPGVDRWFAVIEGAGVVLSFGGERQLLECGAAPLPFRGEDAPVCDLLAGATRDLNLMLRRGQGHGSMRSVVPDEEWLSPAPLRALYSAEPLGLQIDDTDAAALASHTLVWTDQGTRHRWRVPAQGAPPRAWWMEFTAGVSS